MACTAVRPIFALLTSNSLFRRAQALRAVTQSKSLLLIAALGAVLHPTALSAQAGSCAEFRFVMDRSLNMLRDARENLDSTQKKLAEVNILDPRLKREVYARELTRICELARTMIEVAQGAEKQMRDTEARCPAEHFDLGARSLAETTLDYELARRVLANEKLCK